MTFSSRNYLYLHVSKFITAEDGLAKMWGTVFPNFLEAAPLRSAGERSGTLNAGGWRFKM